MCRLALINNAGIRYIENNYGLENLFNYLEKQLGGHGNGCCIIYKDGSYAIDKGVLLTNDIISAEILNNISKIKWVIYHTRLASVGTITDSNCHPFEYNRKVLAMNGTERNYKIINKKLTDTENILLTSNSIKEDTKKYYSVFLGYENGKVFANKNCGSLKYIPCENGGRIFASDFPMVYYKNESVYEAPQNYSEGVRMKELQLAIPKTYYSYGYGCSYDYDYDYNYLYSRGLR